MTDTFIKLPAPGYKERSSFTATAYFRSGDAADTPSTVHYRIDNITTNRNKATSILGWTSATPGTSVSISITSAQNRILDSSNVWERRQLTVSADKGTSTETRDTAEWKIENIGGFNE